MKFNLNFEKAKNLVKKTVIGAGIVGSSLNAMGQAPNEKKDIEPFRRETGFVPAPLNQRKVYTIKKEYKEMVSRGIKSTIKEYENALLDTTISKENKIEIQKMLDEEKKNAEDQIKNYKDISKPYIDSYKEYDKQKEWLKNNISSDEYKKRLKDSEKMGDSTQNKRLMNLEGDYILDENANEYNPDTKKTTVQILASEPEMIHEGGHQMIHNDSLMSEYARNLYKKAYKKVDNPEEKLINFVAGDENKDYYEDAMELDARKKVLEWDMERLKVKKYNETFTDEHYKLLLKLKEEGKLNRNSVEFLDRIKPEYINQIMNTIAVNNPNKDYYHSGWNYGEINDNTA